MGAGVLEDERPAKALFVRDTIDRIFGDPAHRAVQLATDVDPA